MAQESTQQRSRVDAKEDLVFLTSGAKEKLSKTIVGASETAYKMAHPFNKEAREQATEKAKSLKEEVSDKQATIRALAHQQAEADRLGLASPGSSPTPTPRPPSQALGGSPVADTRAGEGPLPHMAPSPAQPSEVQNVFASGVPDDASSGSSSDGSNRAGIPPTAADYRSA